MGNGEWGMGNGEWGKGNGKKFSPSAPPAFLPSYFSRGDSAHFSDVIGKEKTARYEHLGTFAKKSYVFITGSV